MSIPSCGLRRTSPQAILLSLLDGVMMFVRSAHLATGIIAVKRLRILLIPSTPILSLLRVTQFCMTFCTICGIPTLARVGSVKKLGTLLSNLCKRAESAPWKLSGDRESRYHLAKLSTASPRMGTYDPI
jgi:hypothetical protein